MPAARAFTLVELLVVVAIIGVMLAIVVPASGPMIRGQRLSSGQNLVRTALNQARAYAIKEQKYAGLRFQFGREGWRDGRQYLVLVEQRGPGAQEYVPIANVSPIAMPEGIAAIDQRVLVDPWYYTNGLVDSIYRGSILDETTFTVLFSPQGRMVVKNIGVWPRQRYNDPVIDIIDQPGVTGFEPSLLIADGGYWPDNSVYPGADWLPGGKTGAIAPLREDTVTGVVVCSTEELASAGDEGRIAYLDSLVNRGQYLVFNLYTGQAIEAW